jgi:hypothetical protein
MAAFEQLLLRWQGRYWGGRNVVIIEVCERKDDRFRIHLPKLQRVISPNGQADLVSYWDSTEPYRNVEDAGRDAIAIAQRHAFVLHGVRFTSGQVNWVLFDGPDAPTMDAPTLE